MKKIGLLSDTHAYLDPAILDFFEDCDEIWHAGDIGNKEITDQLAAFKPLKAVYGNIDGKPLNWEFPEFIRMDIEGLQVLMIHIAGPIGKYTPRLRELLAEKSPDILVCGHSHICKVAKDDRFNLLYINPGASGRHGFHHMRTILRMILQDGKIAGMELIELGKRSAIDRNT